jgi:2-polyprenyl-3-methyl-5-hydroxy-6-metoxy-1,4-benzoquinol methylase
MSSLREDIEEFMGVPYDEVVKDVVNANDGYIRKLWQEKVPGEVTRENIWQYYMSDQYAAYLFWQAVHEQEKPVLPQVLANVMVSTQRGYVSDRKLYFTPRSILDYGCGIGMTALGLKKMGFEDITLADIPHRYNKFLKFLSDKYNLGFRFVPVEIWNEYPLERKYDVIICNEVLEHVWEPEVTLLHLTEHLEQLGYLYLSTFFNDMNGHDPSHLVKNNVYQDVDKWFGIVEGMGLKKAFQDENGVWNIWQKT